jgi:hypothetical protein
MGQKLPTLRGRISEAFANTPAGQEERLRRKQQEEEKKAEQERIEAERARFGGGGGVSLLPPINKPTLG